MLFKVTACAGCALSFVCFAPTFRIAEPGDSALPITRFSMVRLWNEAVAFPHAPATTRFLPSAWIRFSIVAVTLSLSARMNAPSSLANGVVSREDTVSLLMVYVLPLKVPAYEMSKSSAANTAVSKVFGKCNFILYEFQGFLVCRCILTSCAWKTQYTHRAYYIAFKMRCTAEKTVPIGLSEEFHEFIFSGAHDSPPEEALV